MSKDLLLEIGIDGFPSELTGLVKRVLDEEFSKILYTNHIHFDKIMVESTKTRIVLIAQNLIENESEIEDLYTFFKENIPNIITNVTIPIYHEVDPRKCHFIHYITWIQCVYHDQLIHFDQTDDIYDNKNNEKEVAFDSLVELVVVYLPNIMRDVDDPPEHMKSINDSTIYKKIKRLYLIL